MAGNKVVSQSKPADQAVVERYAPQVIEPQLLEFWEKKKIFAFNPASKKTVYSIDTPPPTVSGKMHIGHAFSYTQQDIIARYKRLRGFEVFYPFGTDDNGLPTERLVEKIKKVKGTKMDRAEFVKLCQETLKEITPEFVQGWKRIGISCDFNLFYSTINENCQRISQQAFLDLVKKKRAYRKEAPSLWCPQCETAISQVECEDAEQQSTFNDLVFKTAGNKSDKKSGIKSEAVEGKELIIATTRPEMLSACVAIFAHPDDERYKKLFGTKAIVPLYNHEVPIMPDQRADPSKGTGIVMCCTFGDQTDMEWYRAYNLPLKQAIGKDGKMTALSGQYAGMKIAECRKTIIADLTAQGLIKATKPITHTVNVHERCSTPIEIIQSKQWFIKYLDLKEDLLKWGAELTWHPAFMKSRYDNWVKGLQWDWLISRQRFFGIPFPVWYCEKCDTPVFADEKKLPIDPLKTHPPLKKCACGSTAFVPEKDVLDTWATSSLTPQLATSLVEEKYRKKLMPMSLRPQAHDIITFWLFNTLVRSRLHNGVNPWKEIVISGYVTMSGEKMGKSKGNVVDPQEVVTKYSADAVRYWASSSKFGDDLDYQEKEVRTGDKFVTKLWNATKFAGTHLADYNCTVSNKEILKDITESTDTWIVAKLNNAIIDATEHFDKYDYAHAKSALEKFFWQEYCDNYLELAKIRLYEPKTPQQRTSAQATLFICTRALLTLFAPFTPFITEHIYQANKTLFQDTEKDSSVHTTVWPAPIGSNDARTAAIEKAGDIIVSVLSAVRKKKSEAKLSMKAPVQKIVIELTAIEAKVEESVKEMVVDLKATTAAQEIVFGKAEEEVMSGVKVSVEL